LPVDGQLLATDSRLDVINPATGAVFAHCPAAGAPELDAAVAAARRAFPAWRDLSWEQRAGYIERFAEALETHKEPLARLLTQEQGKPLSQARDEITRAGTLSVGMTKIRVEPETLLDNAGRHVE